MQTRVQAEGACADPVELEAALQQLKVAAEAGGTHTEPAPKVHGICLFTLFVCLIIATICTGNKFQL